MSDDSPSKITSDGTPEPERSPSPGRNRTRTAVVGVLASGVALAGSGALFLGTGAATAAPVPHPKAVVSVPQAVTGATWVKAFAAKSPVTQAAAAKALARAAAQRAGAPGVVPAAETPDVQAAGEFFAKGYTYDDAVSLAKTWNLADAWSAKVKGGHELEAGQTLPTAPGSAAAAPTAPDTEDASVAEFFAKGYTYDDAVRLGAIWHTVDPYHAKIKGGAKLEAGQTLPIAP